MIRRFNTEVIGASQFGKSTAIKALQIAPAIDAGACAVVVEDGHDTLAESVAEYALAKNQGFRTVVIDLKDLRWVCAWEFISRPTVGTWREKRQQAVDSARELADILVGFRGSEYGGLDGKPQLKEWTIGCILLWMFQKDNLPLEMLPWGLQPGTLEFQRLLDGCTDPEIYAKFSLLQAVARQSKVELSKTVGPASRLFDELFQDEAFRVRASMEWTINLEVALKEKLILIVKGGSNPNTTRVLMRALNQKIIAIIKKHWAQHHQPLPVWIFMDEAANFGLIGQAEANAMAECLKMMTCPVTGKGGFTIITQTPDYGDESVNAKVSQCCTVKLVFHCSGIVAELAKKELRAGLDPFKVKRLITRMEHTGEFVKKETESHGTRKDPKTGKDVKDVRVNETFQPKIEPKTEEELWGLHDLDMMNEVFLQRLPVGGCVKRDGPSIEILTITPLKDPWSFPGLGRKMLEEHMIAQRKMGVFREVLDSPPQWTPPPPPAPKQPKPKKPPTPKGKKKK